MKRKKGKPRKRTNKNVPAKGRLCKFADDLWGLAVKGDWGRRCAVCGKRDSDGQLHPHHMIPRQWEATRYLLRNGIELCANCHVWDPDISPHQNAAGWILWLSEHQRDLHIWYTVTIATNEHTQFAANGGKKTPLYYCETILRLKEYVPEADYVRIVGVRFAKWLETEGVK